MSYSEEKNQITLVKNLKKKEKIFAKTFKGLAYGIESLKMIPHLIKYGLTPNNRVSSYQTKKYTLNNEFIYTSPSEIPKDQSQENNVKSIGEFFFSVASKHPERKCMGKRQIINKSEETCPKGLKNVIKYDFGKYVWTSYSQVSSQVCCLCKWLIDMKFDDDNKMAIFGNTSPQWLMMTLALVNIKSPLVTVYPTLPDEGVIHALELTEVSALMVDERTLARVSGFLSLLPNIKHIIYYSYLEDPVTWQIPAGISIYNFNNLTLYKSDTDPHSQRAQDPSSTALIMFTSGSTGIPKGVMISHKNLMSSYRSVCKRTELKARHVFAAFLPSSHIFELSFEFLLLFTGNAIGFCTPQTLFDTSPLIKSGSRGDLTILKPTMMIFVPLLIERLRISIFEKLETRSRWSQIMFQTAYNTKSFIRSYGFTTPVLDFLVFRRLKQLFGGRLKIGFIGGACISRNNEIFANICLGNFKQGYGLTETTSGITLVHSNYMATGSCGSPLPYSEIKLIPWIEGNYDPKDPEMPSGEIAICGDSIAIGYYKNEELTNTSFCVDPLSGKRWFYTGDIGTIRADGSLVVIDRKKDIVKLLNGEYISLKMVESIIAECDLVDSCCVLPSLSMEYTIALIIPNRERMKELLLKDESINDNDEIDFDKLTENSLFMSKIEWQIKAYVENSREKMPKKYHILSDIWTPENNLLTPTFKIRRHEIAKKYNNLLQ